VTGFKNEEISIDLSSTYSLFNVSDWRCQQLTTTVLQIDSITEADGITPFSDALGLISLSGNNLTVNSSQSMTEKIVGVKVVTI